MKHLTSKKKIAVIIHRSEKQYRRCLSLIENRPVNYVIVNVTALSVQYIKLYDFISIGTL